MLQPVIPSAKYNAASCQPKNSAAMCPSSVKVTIPERTRLNVAPSPSPALTVAAALGVMSMPFCAQCANFLSAIAVSPTTLAGLSRGLAEQHRKVDGSAIGAHVRLKRLLNTLPGDSGTPPQTATICECTHVGSFVAKSDALSRKRKWAGARDLRILFLNRARSSEEHIPAFAKYRRNASIRVAPAGWPSAPILSPVRRVPSIAGLRLAKKN